MYLDSKYLAAGDRALVIEYGDTISQQINDKVRAMTIAIEENKLKGIIEVVPTYRSLIVHYNPFDIDYDSLIKSLKELEDKMSKIELPDTIVIEIPTAYGGEYGPDIENVAKSNALSIEEVIEIHTSKEYRIYMLGFTPGFPYLGGMDERISTPRLKSPRTKINGGSVGIAGNQTGIYPIDSPGGWQLIGRTPLKLYDPYREKPILLKSGDYIKFVEIKENEYIKIEKEIKKGSYTFKTYTKKRWGV